MRKFFILTNLLFVLLSRPPRAFPAPLFRYVEFKESASINLPLLESEDEKSLAFDAGLSLVGSFFQIRGFITLPETDFFTLKNTTYKNVPTLFENQRYGAEFHLDDFFFPFSLKAGSLSFSRSLSKLTSPAPSSTSPLTAGFSTATGLAPSLPTLSSTQKPLSASVSLSKKHSRLSVKSDLSATEEGNPAFNAGIFYKLNRASSLGLSFTTTCTTLENTSSTLEKAGGSFEKGQFLFSCLEAFALFPHLKVYGVASLNQNPYGSEALWFRSKIRFITGNLLVDAGFFIIPTAASNPRTAPLVTASSNICRTTQLYMINPQIQFYISPKAHTTFRAGAFVQYQEKILSDRYASVAELIKTGAGIKIENSGFSFKADTSATNIPLSVTAGATPSALNDFYYDGGISFTMSKKDFRFVSSLGIKYYPPHQELRTIDEKRLYSASFSLNPGKIPLSLQAGYDATVKKGSPTSESVDASVTATIKGNHLRAKIKMAVILPLR